MSSYLVIARKWRPGLFEEIVGQGHVTRTLKNAVLAGRIAHAYLFSGPRGVGKTTAARILAKGLNCSSGPTPAPCNSCESCKGIAAGSSVDVLEIDGASNNSVDNVRELTESVRYVPSHGKYKVYIIDEVHMLSTAAFNALLKTLEEPPPHAVFIFATTEVHKIPLTILSRCQRFDFKRIPFREIQQHLKRIVAQEGIKFEEKALFTLAREADGSLRDAQSLLEQVVAFGAGEVKDTDVAEALGLMDRSMLYDLSGAIASGDGGACLNIVEKVYDFGYDLKRACSDLLEHIRDLAVMKITGESSLLDLPDSELERLKATAGAIGAERLQMVFSIMAKGYEEVSRSASPRYSLEMALLRAAHCEDAAGVRELVERLEALRPMIIPGAPAQRPDARPSVKYEPGVGLDAQNRARQPEPLTAREPAPEYAAPEAEPGSIADYIRKKIPSLAEPLASASITEEGGRVEINAPAPKCKVLEIKHKQLESVCAEFYKRRVLVAISPAGEGAAEKKKDTADPVIKDAVRILGGKVIEDRRRTTNV